MAPRTDEPTRSIPQTVKLHLIVQIDRTYRDATECALLVSNVIADSTENARVVASSAVTREVATVLQEAISAYVLRSIARTDGEPQTMT